MEDVGSDFSVEGGLARDIGVGLEEVAILILVLMGSLQEEVLLYNEPLLLQIGVAPCLG